ARGQEYSNYYHENCKYGYKDDGFWDGCLTVRRAYAQQKAACKTAAGYKNGLIKHANEKAYNLRHQRTQFRCLVISGAQQTRKDIEDTHKALVKGLEAGRDQVLDALLLALTKNLEAIDTAEAESLSTLTKQERS